MLTQVEGVALLTVDPSLCVFGVVAALLFGNASSRW